MSKLIHVLAGACTRTAQPARRLSMRAALVLLLCAGLPGPAFAQAPASGATAERVTLLPAAAGADIARQVALELKSGDFAALESRFDDGMKAALPDAALRLFWADTLQRAGALRGCGEPRMRTAGEFTLAFSSCEFEKQRTELRLTMRPDGRLAGMFLSPESRGPAGMDRPRLREPGGLLRARDVRRVRPRDAARDALDPEGRRAVPGRRPRPRVRAARSRRDRRRHARLRGPRAGSRVARRRRPALREEDEDVPEGARGNAGHDAQGRGARRRRRRARRAAPDAGSRPGARVRPRPQSRRDARAADRADGREDGRDRPPRRAVAPDVRGRPRPGRRALRCRGEREPEGAGPVPSARGGRARGPLRRKARRVSDGDDLRSAAGVLARAEEGEAGGDGRAARRPDPRPAGRAGLPGDDEGLRALAGRAQGREAGDVSRRIQS